MQNVNEHSLSLGVLKIFRRICVFYAPLGVFLPDYWGLLWASVWLVLAFKLPDLQRFILSRQLLGPWDYQLMQKGQQRH